MVLGRKRRRRRCSFCGQLFFSEPRLKGRQHACSELSCQAKRKEANQKRGSRDTPATSAAATRRPNHGSTRGRGTWLGIERSILKWWRETTWPARVATFE